MRLMTWICSFLFASSLAAQQISFPFPTTVCMTIDEAKNVLAAKLASRVKICARYEEAEVVVDFDMYDASYVAGPYSCQSRSEIINAIKNLSYNEKTQLFTSSTAWSYYCAAGAQCWGGYTLDCYGRIGSWFTVEE